MPTLVVNAGSSSHKLVLFGDTGERLWSGALDWSDRGGALAQSQGQLLQALEEQLERMSSAGHASGSIGLVGHRIVHGGDHSRSTVALDEEVAQELSELRRLAPLHNGPALDTLAVLQELLPAASHVAALTRPSTAACRWNRRPWPFQLNGATAACNALGSMGSAMEPLHGGFQPNGC